MESLEVTLDQKSKFIWIYNQLLATNEVQPEWSRVDQGVFVIYHPNDAPIRIHWFELLITVICPAVVGRLSYEQKITELAALQKLKYEFLQEMYEHLFIYMHTKRPALHPINYIFNILNKKSDESSSVRNTKEQSV